MRRIFSIPLHISLNSLREMGEREISDPFGSFFVISCSIFILFWADLICFSASVILNKVILASVHLNEVRFFGPGHIA